MSTFDGIRCPTRAEADEIAAAQFAGVGGRRCPRLGGTLTRDRVPVRAADRSVCPCTIVDAPDAACPHTASAEVEVVDVHPSGYAVGVSPKAAARAALTAGQRARIEAIDARDRRGPPEGVGGGGGARVERV